MTYPNLLERDDSTSAPPEDNTVMTTEQVAAYEQDLEEQRTATAGRRARMLEAQHEREAREAQVKETELAHAAELASQAETAAAAEPELSAQNMANLEAALAPKSEP